MDRRRTRRRMLPERGINVNWYSFISSHFMQKTIQIWEGQVKKRAFRDISIVTVTIEKQARDFFEKHGVAQYWDLAFSSSVLLDDQDPLPI